MNKMRRATSATNSNFAVNTTQQLVDSLTAHLSLYNSASPSPTPSPSPTRRSAIIKWFSSLPVQQRRAHLTVVDFSFAQILLQMLRELQLRGRGFFLVMPDVPGDHLSSVPSFCFRKARGLLDRVAESSESERAIRESARMFSSREGENAASMGANGCIDSVTVTEELVENVDRFVGIMDAASGGGFLKGEESVELATEWAEMEWLKGKGYYSMEAFVVNRLEVALRLAWLNCNNGGKKRGVKLKEKINAATNSGNVFWRKKGCLDWWMKLDEAVKKKLFRMAVAKVAKRLCAETYKGKNVLAVDMSRSRLQGEPDMKNGAAGYPFQLKCLLNVLMILQDVYSMLAAFQPSCHDAGAIFFSSFASVNTTADCIFQKLREILMVVSLDCTKFELLDEGTVNSSMKKQKEKLGASNHKKKGKNRNTKKPNSVARSSGNDCSFLNPTEACSSGDKKADLQSPTKKKKKEKKRVKSSNTQKSVEVTCCEITENESATMSALPQGRDGKSNCVTENPVAESANVTIDKHGLDNSSISVPPTTIVGGYPEDNKFSGLKNCQISETASPNGAVASYVETTEVDVGLKDVHSKAKSSDTSMNSANCKRQNEVRTKFIPSCKLSQNYGFREQAIPLRVKGSPSFCDMGIITSSSYISYEWPSLAPPQLSPYNSYLPAATDRLHLDAGHNWHNHFHQPLVPAVQGMRSASVENGFGVVSQPVPMSLDWPPVVRGINRLAPPIACNYDSGFISRRRNSFQQSFPASSAHCSMMSSEDERLCSGEVIDMSDVTNSLELADDPENHWMSEDELELHSLTGMDYNQHFGGGVMYWNPSDFPGSSFSRPPSLSSEDSSWAWREADINRAVDDMVAFSSSYSTNGLTSPSAASFCSPFDPLGPGGQAMGYVLSDSEIAGKVLHSSPTVADFVGDENVSGSLSTMSGDGEAKAKAGDSLHYPILRPIIIPSIPRDLQKPDLKQTEHKSPRIPPNGREAHRIKRPPSPVVLCVPRAPRPPPPSPVGDSRRHRGFPTVRSGSSSPRHWGVKGWSHDGINFEEACIRMDGSEVVWPSWRNKSLQARKLTQPVPGALLQDRLIAISQLTRDQDHPDVAFPLQPVDCSTPKASLPVLHGFLHDEIDSFCKQVASENFARKPSINWAVKRVTRSLQVLWPRSQTNIFGSNATGLSLPSSDVDLVVSLPPVRNLEPIKEAGILEGRNGIKETCLQHAARYLANQEWVKNDSLKIVENTAIPIIMLVVEVPQDLIASSAATVQNTSEQGSSVADLSGLEISASLSCSKMKHGPEKDVKSVRIDISFKSPSHTGLQTTELVKELTEQFPAAKPLALVLKKFLADRSLDQSYSGGLSSHCLLLLIIRFLQHEFHLGRSISQNFGSLLMDFLYFFGNVFDPRQMRISVQGSGMYINRVEGYSIDPIYIDDPLFPTNNVGRNCFRIHQCIKAFADAYSTLENELAELPSNDDLNIQPPCKLLPKIIPSIDHSVGS